MPPSDHTPKHRNAVLVLSGLIEHQCHQKKTPWLATHTLVLRITSVQAVELVRITSQRFHLEIGVRIQKVHLAILSLKEAWALRLEAWPRNKPTK